MRSRFRRKSTLVAAVALAAALGRLAAASGPAGSPGPATPAGPAAPADPAAAARPHILLVTVDTLRADRLSGYGYGRSTSPRLDALMSAGARFESARTIEPLTTPALASLLTSLDPHVHGSTRNGLRIHDGLDSLPLALARGGWTTAAFVSNWTLRDKLSNLGGHFDHFEEVFTRKRWFGLFNAEATATDVTDHALAWIASRDRSTSREPLFLWAHYVEPHAPYIRQDAYLEQIGVRPGGGLSKADRYDSEIAFVDAEIGRLLDGVRARVEASRLMVVFTADHGESLGEHGHWGHGRHLFDTTLRVPMAIAWPGRIAPAVVDAPALVTDIPRTVLSLAGLAQPEEFGGFDWGPVLDGLAGAPFDRVTFYQSHKGAVRRGAEPGRGVRTSGLLRVAQIAGGRKEILRVNKPGRRMVFDLRTDPAEGRNLVDSSAGAAGTGRAPAPPRASKHLTDAERIASLQAWLGRVREGLVHADQVLSADVGEQDEEKLRALGYLD